VDEPHRIGHARACWKLPEQVHAFRLAASSFLGRHYAFSISTLLSRINRFPCGLSEMEILRSLPALSARQTVAGDTRYALQNSLIGNARTFGSGPDHGLRPVSPGALGFI
jgi:hypothetical protein